MFFDEHFPQNVFAGAFSKKKKNEPMIIYLSNIDYFLKNEKICFSLSISVNAHISFWIAVTQFFLYFLKLVEGMSFLFIRHQNRR